MAVKFRNELKYLVEVSEVRIVEEKLRHLMQLDPFVNRAAGYYIVRSLYFDDYEDDCYYNNEFSLGIRRKYRIRMYGEDLSYIVLEKKEKENSLSRKFSYKLTLEEYEQLVRGDVSRLYWESSDPLLKEFCLEVMTKLFRPKVVVHYERTPFVTFPGNVRVTLDKNISCSGQLHRFLEGDYTKVPVMEEGYHLLEVKYDEFLPDFIKQVIQLDTLEQATFSKYYLSRATSINHGGL